jgi:hypothetical protein
MQSVVTKKKTHDAGNWHFGPKLSWFGPGSLKSSLIQHKLHFFFSPWLAGLMEWTFSYVGKGRLRVSHLEPFTWFCFEKVDFLSSYKRLKHHPCNWGY